MINFLYNTQQLYNIFSATNFVEHEIGCIVSEANRDSFEKFLNKKAITFRNVSSALERKFVILVNKRSQLLSLLEQQAYYRINQLCEDASHDVLLHQKFYTKDERKLFPVRVQHEIESSVLNYYRSFGFPF